MYQEYIAKSTEAKQRYLLSYTAQKRCTMERTSEIVEKTVVTKKTSSQREKFMSEEKMVREFRETNTRIKIEMGTMKTRPDPGSGSTDRWMIQYRNVLGLRF